MKVYIIYEKDGYGGSQVDRVFKNRASARVYVVTESMAHNAKNQDELDKMCDGHIEEHDVIEDLTSLLTHF